MEHPEVLTFFSQYEGVYYMDLISRLLMTYLNSRLHYAVDTGVEIFAHLAAVFML